jgi:hypothetical protein
MGKANSQAMCRCKIRYGVVALPHNNTGKTLGAQVILDFSPATDFGTYLRARGCAHLFSREAAAGISKSCHRFAVPNKFPVCVPGTGVPGYRITPLRGSNQKLVCNDEDWRGSSHNTVSRFKTKT